MYDPLLNIINQYSGHGNFHPIVDWNRMKSTVERRIENYTNRILNTAMPSTAWSRFIKVLLNMVPVPTILNMPSTSSRYAYMLLDVVGKIDSFLAPNFTIKSRYNLFVSANNNISVQEYLIPCRSETPLLDLPLGDNLQYWKSVRPIKILYNDSLELCGDFLHGDFAYTDIYPSQLIVGIDTPSLVFKYVTYCEDCVRNKKPILKTEFIQQHLVSTLYYDVFNCWVLQLLNHLVCSPNAEATAADDLIVHPNIVSDAMVDVAATNLIMFRVNMANMNYRLDDMMESNWLSDKGWDQCSNLKSLMFAYEHSITLPAVRHGAYIKFMIDFQLVRLVVMMNRLMNTSVAWKMNKELRYVLMRFKQANTLNACQNIPLRNKLIRELDEVISLCNKYADGIDPEPTSSTFEY